MIRVLVVDDQALLRSGLAAILDRDDGITVAGQAEDGREALRVARKVRPDVVLMDLRMPVMDGVQAIRAIRADPLLAATPVLVLTTFDDDDDVVEAIAAGADGYLLKDIEADDLRASVRRATAGSVEISSPVLRRMMDRVARLPTRGAQRQHLAGLTEREIEILTQVGLGLRNEEIGRALYLSPDTARTYVSRLMTKLDARDRAELVALAHRAGLVE